MTRLSQIEVDIPTAGTSLEQDLRNHRLVGIVMPAAWTAAAITFACAGVAADGSRATGTEAFQSVVDSAGAELSISAAQGKYVTLTEAHRNACTGLGRVKIQSGPAAGIVVQAAIRRLILIVEIRE